MKYNIYSNNIKDYLKLDNIIDYDNGLIKDLSDILYEKSNGIIDYIKNCFEYVRDNIKHSNDYGIILPKILLNGGYTNDTSGDIGFDKAL